MDCEWNADVYARQELPCQLALLQLASQTRCYLIDMFKLKGTAGTEEWRHLAALFANPRIIKVGFDLKQDSLMLKPYVASYEDGKGGVVDLMRVATGLKDGTGTSSLANLVNQLLGYPLSKVEQRSNWETRPLRKAQIVYAATDAHVLVELALLPKFQLACLASKPG